MADLAALTAAIEAGDRATAVRITREAVEEGLDPRTVLGAMTVAMEVIGAKFQCQEIYVPEMLISARAMKEATAVLEPVLVKAGIRPEHTAVLGTIKGDLHDIGKNLVGMMWKGANIEVIDLGTNVTPERFVEAAKEHGATIVGISALLTTTMVGMKDVVTAIRAANLADVKVIVGGAPLTQDFADMIGADGYASDAASAVEAARKAIRGG
jgi:5-methyltetrahydrofolate--homocysteine methyltransferase